MVFTAGLREQKGRGDVVVSAGSVRETPLTLVSPK